MQDYNYETECLHSDSWKEKEYVKCNKCGEKHIENIFYEYCPHCGERLKGDNIKIAKEDFFKALEGWYWGLDECNDTYDEKFWNVMDKYNITLKDLGINRDRL
jgi:ribosomal protein L32